jgi:transposase-like protein
MSGLKPKIGAKQEAAVLALLSSKNVEEAARAAGVTPRTLYRWMSEADFDAAYRAARRRAYGQSISRLQQGSTADPATPPSTRVRAAEAVLSQAAKAIEIEDIDARVRTLEEATEANKCGRRP